MSTPHETYQLVVLSTAHLLPDTAEQLKDVAARLPFIVAPFEEGYFVSCAGLMILDGQTQRHVPDNGGPEEPQSLWDCRRWAADKGYRYILFDRDADTVEGLQAYEW